MPRTSLQHSSRSRILTGYGQILNTGLLAAEAPSCWLGRLSCFPLAALLKLLGRSLGRMRAAGKRSGVIDSDVGTVIYTRQLLAPMRQPEKASVLPHVYKNKAGARDQAQKLWKADRS